MSKLHLSRNTSKQESRRSICVVTQEVRDCPTDKEKKTMERASLMFSVYTIKKGGRTAIKLRYPKPESTAHATFIVPYSDLERLNARGGKASRAHQVTMCLDSVVLSCNQKHSANESGEVLAEGLQAL